MNLYCIRVISFFFLDVHLSVPFQEKENSNERKICKPSKAVQRKTARATNANKPKNTSMPHKNDLERAASSKQRKCAVKAVNVQEQRRSIRAC